MAKYYVGIHSGHNSSVCLLKDGEVLQCVSEERYTNVKNQDGFPRLAFETLFKDHRLRPEDVSAFCFAGIGAGPTFSPSTDGGKEYGGVWSRIIEWGKSVGLNKRAFSLWAFYNVVYPRLCRSARKKEVDFLIKNYGIERKKIRLYDHHSCHAAAAYYGSPFNQDRCLVFTLDSEGDGLCASVSIAEGGNWRRIAATPLGNSPGDLYMYVTQYLGMKPGEHEYKVMGLAPYTRYIDRTYQAIKNYIGFTDGDGLVFRAAFDTHLSYPRFKRALEGHRFDSIAGAFQKLITENIVRWIKNAIRKTGIRKVCLGGGVFMNVKANYEVLAMDEVEKLFVFPSCSDESISIGAAYQGFSDSEKGGAVQSIGTIYWGEGFSNEEIERYIKEHGLDKKYRVSYHADIEEVIARRLAENEIVAVVSGRMEFGARALGNRSILANPSDRDNVRIINEQIKLRDFWMPFACSILAEDVADYVDIPKGYRAYYMMVAFPSTAAGRKHLIAGMHPYDFTIRPQVVQKEDNPRYHKIISEFKKTTGIGGILNTSFNLHGLPIVRGPREAAQAFENSGLKYLVLENYLIEK